MNSVSCPQSKVGSDSEPIIWSLYKGIRVVMAENNSSLKLEKNLKSEACASPSIRA